MNILHLSGYGVKIKVSNIRTRSELCVTDGREDFKHEGTVHSFRPRRIPYDTIIVDGHSGYVSLQDSARALLQFLMRRKRVSGKGLSRKFSPK
jgi:hypothetical protein